MTRWTKAKLLSCVVVEDRGSLSSLGRDVASEVAAPAEDKMGPGAGPLLGGEGKSSNRPSLATLISQFALAYFPGSSLHDASSQAGPQ